MTTFRPGGWSDEHEEETDTPADAGEMIWERPRELPTATFVPRLGIAGPDPDMPYAYATTILERLIALETKPLVIAHEPDGWERVHFLRRAFAGDIDPAHIVCVTPGAQEPQTALLQAVATELTARFPEANAVCLIGSGDATPEILDPALVHYTVGVLDAATMTHLVPAPLMTTDSLIIHAPRDGSRYRMRAVIADIIASRGRMPTHVVDLDRARALDDVFGMIWTDVFC